MEGATVGTWQACRVIDLSIGGAGLELFGAPTTTTGDRLVLDLDRPGRAVGVQLVGEITDISDLRATGDVRHAHPGDQGLRVGIEFVQVTAAVQDIITTLLANRQLV